MNTRIYAFITAFLISLFCIAAYAQNDEIDSLKELLAKHTDADTFRINILNELAFAFYYINKDKTLHYAEEADSLSDLINFTKGKALSLNNIGLYYYDKSDYNEALKYFENSLELNTEINDQAGKAKSYNNIGIIYELQGDYPQSLDYYQRSLNIKMAIGDSLGMASSYNNIGIVNHNLGDYPSALDYYQKCLQIEKELGDSSGMSGSFSNIGIIYNELGDYSTALEYQERSLFIRKALKDSTGTAISFNNIGSIYEEMKDLPKALNYYKNALLIVEAMECKRKIALYNNHIGKIYLQMSQFSHAIEHFQKGLDIAEEIRALSVISRIHRNLSCVYFEKKQYNLALLYGEKAYSTAVEIDYKDLIKDASEILAKVNAAMGNYKKAYRYLSEFKTQSDSLINEDNIKKITALEFEYKYEQEKKLARAEQDKIDVLNDQELIRQKTIRNSFMIGFGLTMLFMLIILRSFIQKRKANKILLEQKQIIEETNNELTAALSLVNEQKDQISEKNELLQKQNDQITDSINYASRIQSAVMPQAEFLNTILPEHFVLFKPRDIVSGDFYWAEKIKNYIIVVTADCTGHGVPGAFMSMLGISILNELIRKNEIVQSDLILEEFRDRIKKTLWQTGDQQEQKEGMDLALYIIDTKTNMLDYSGANNPLYLFRNDELLVYTPNLQPVGVYLREKPFSNHLVQLQKGDCLYTFSDGYADQLGGKKKRKFLEKRFQEVLKEIHKKEIEEQKRTLEERLLAWQGDVPQMDDILVFGVRV